MSTPAIFPDVEYALIDWLKSTFPALADPDVDHADEHVGTETPVDLQARFPFVVVNRTAGGDSELEDYPVIDLEVFDSKRGPAYTLAEAIRSQLLNRLLLAGGVRIDKAETEIGPRRLPWEADGTVRVAAEYRLTVRRR